MRNAEEGFPERATDASVLDGISFMATGEKTPTVLGAKPRPCTPMVRYSTDVGESEGSRFEGGKSVTGDDTSSLPLIRDRAKDPPGLNGNEGPE